METKWGNWTMKSVSPKFYYDETKPVYWLEVLFFNGVLLIQFLWKHKKQMLTFFFGDNLITFLGGAFSVASGLLYIGLTLGWF